MWRVKDQKVQKMEHFSHYFDSKWTIGKLRESGDNFSQFPDFSRINDILGDFGTEFPIGTHCLVLMLYRVTKQHLLSSLCRRIGGSIDLSSLHMTDLVSPLIFT